MAMENSDTVMPTSRNPGRLDMADTAETGTDVALLTRISPASVKLSLANS